MSAFKPIIACSLILFSLSAQVLAEQDVVRDSGFIASIEIKEGTSGLLNLPLRLRGVERCIFGDIDAIFFDLMASAAKKRKLLLSVEPLLAHDRSFAGASFDITSVPGLYTQGFLANLEIPLQEKPRILAIYICKDSDGTNTCRDKRIIPTEEILARYAKGTKAAEGTPTDKIYFFQPLYVVGRKLHFTTVGLTESRYELVKQMLLQEGMSSREVDAAVSLVSNLNKTLGSVPLANNGNEVGIVLPKYRPGKCR